MTAAIAAALGDPEDAALRDYAARCLAEFLTWAVKCAARLRRNFGLVSFCVYQASFSKEGTAWGTTPRAAWPSS